MKTSSTQLQAISNSLSTSSTLAIKTENLTKSYGQNRGVTDLNLEVYQGEVFGFLGPNGAGKTTTIRLLLNLIKPTAGRASINQKDSQRGTVAIHREIGYLPGEFSLYPNLSGAKVLQYFANLRGGVDWKYITHLAERLDLNLTKKFRQYSRGNKQKIGIIQALMHKPRLLILDEPTSGLDPLNQQEFYTLIKEVQQDGRTVFFSSHIMSEVEKVCSRVGIIRNGQLIKVGNINELTGIKTQQLELTFRGNAPLDEMRGLPGVLNIEKLPNSGNEGEILLCTVSSEAIDPVIKLAAHYSIVNFATYEPSLEEIFLNYYKD